LSLHQSRLCWKNRGVRWIVPCPAKLNLFLSVGPRDQRGYHPLRTLFQAIDLCDRLEIEVSDRNEVLCDDPSVPEQNTVTRTLRLLAEVVSLPPLRVRLIKHIPSQAGLGGGSSDAAGLIRAAKAIGKNPIPEAELLGLAQTIGADVPFFLTGGRAKAEGYGERLTPLPDVDEWYVVAKPVVGCDTPDAFRRLDEKPYEWLPFPGGDILYNDFERVAPCESLELTERLRIHGARDSGLTGSGSAVFGRFDSDTSAESAANALRAERVEQVWKCRSLTRAESLSLTAEP
jgi:4-diphosphocytidyl-2-C-methyl-D-erythritol kinase